MCSQNNKKSVRLATIMTLKTVCSTKFFIESQKKDPRKGLICLKFPKIWIFKGSVREK